MKPAEINARRKLVADPRYRVSVRQQLILWMNGKSVHNAFANECCPDFSCCFPDLAMSMPERLKYARNYFERDQP